MSFVGSVRGWLKLTGSSVDLAENAKTPQKRTIDVKLLVAEVDGRSAGTGSLQSVRIHGSVLPPVADALASGASVYLGTTGNISDPVLFSLVSSQDDGFYFAGDCQYFALTKPLHDRLATSFDVAMSKIIGLTTSAEIENALSPGSSSSSGSP